MLGEGLLSAPPWALASRHRRPEFAARCNARLIVPLLRPARPRLLPPTHGPPTSSIVTRFSRRGQEPFDAMRVVFVATEVAPWSKTGGLADVMAALTAELADSGHQVMTVSPLYESLADAQNTGITVPVRLPPRDRHGAALSHPRTLHRGQEVGRGRPFSSSVGARRIGGSVPLGDGSRVLLDRLKGSSMKGRLARFLRRRRADSRSGAGAWSPDADTVSSSNNSLEDTELSSVRLYAASRDGVRHVFVDHPLFQEGAGGPSQMTYTDSCGAGGGGPMAAQARASLLCQAALAAPALLWLSPELVPEPGGLLPRMVQHGLGRPAADYSIPGSSLAASLNSAQQGQRMPRERSGRRARRLLGGRPASVDASAAASGSSPEANSDFGAGIESPADGPPVIFVANDWPAGLLPLWLDAYIDSDVTDDLSSIAQSKSWRGVESVAVRQGVAGSKHSRGRSDSGCGRARGAAAGPSPAAGGRGSESGSRSGSDGGRREMIHAASSLPHSLESRSPVRVLSQQPQESAVEGWTLEGPVNGGRGTGPGRPQRMCGADAIGENDAGLRDTPPARHGSAISAAHGFPMPAVAPQLVASCTTLEGSDTSGVTVLGRQTGLSRGSKRKALAPTTEAGQDLGAGSDGRGHPESSNRCEETPEVTEEVDGIKVISAAEAGQPPRGIVEIAHPPGGDRVLGQPLGTDRALAQSLGTIGTPPGANRTHVQRLGTDRLQAQPLGAPGFLSFGTSSSRTLFGCSGQQHLRSQPPADQPDTFEEAGGKLVGSWGEAEGEPAWDELTAAEPRQDRKSSAVSRRRARRRGGRATVVCLPSRLLLERAMRSFQRLVRSKLHDARFVLAIHNFGFHGLFPADSFGALGLPARQLPLLLTDAVADGSSWEAGPQGGDGEVPTDASVREMNAAGSAPGKSMREVKSRSNDGVSTSATSAADQQSYMASGCADLSIAGDAVNSGSGSGVHPSQICWLQAALLASDLVVTVSPQHARELRDASAEALLLGGGASGSHPQHASESSEHEGEGKEWVPSVGASPGVQALIVEGASTHPAGVAAASAALRGAQSFASSSAAQAAGGPRPSAAMAADLLLRASSLAGSWRGTDGVSRTQRSARAPPTQQTPDTVDRADAAAEAAGQLVPAASPSGRALSDGGVTSSAGSGAAGTGAGVSVTATAQDGRPVASWPVGCRSLLGIMNGVDTAVWNPALDPLLPAGLRYSPDTVTEGKAAAKRVLQVHLGLTPDPSVPLFAYIGRLEDQKGVDVLLAALPELLGPSTSGAHMYNVLLHCDPAAVATAAAAAARLTAEVGAPENAAGSAGVGCASAGGSAAGGAGAGLQDGPPGSDCEAGSPAASLPASRPPLQLAFLGRGQAWMEQALGLMQAAYPGSAVGVPRHDEALAHLMLAAADFVLVPSRYEPCGLIALCAVTYGAVPVVSPVGGLFDIAMGRFGQQHRGEEAGVDLPPACLSSNSVAGDLHAFLEEDAGAGAAAAARNYPRGHSPAQGPQGPLAEPGGKGHGPLGYLFSEAIGPSGDAVAARRAAAVVVSGVLRAAVDYYVAQGATTTAQEPALPLAAGVAESLPSVTGLDAANSVFLGRRARCMRADVSWTRALQEWQDALRSLACQRVPRQASGVSQADE